MRISNCIININECGAANLRGVERGIKRNAEIESCIQYTDQPMTTRWPDDLTTCRSLSTALPFPWIMATNSSPYLRVTVCACIPLPNTRSWHSSQRPCLQPHSQIHFAEILGDAGSHLVHFSPSSLVSVTNEWFPVSEYLFPLQDILVFYS